MHQDSPAAFPRERAFVVQLHRDADLKNGRLEGRIEHVSSGHSAHFQHLHELEAFFRQALNASRQVMSSDQNDEPDRVGP